MVDLQLGLGAVLRGLPHVVEHSEGVSDLVETVLDVTPCSLIIPYRAAQVSELLRCLQVFSVKMNWFRVGNVQQHHFCFLLADLQVNLLCVGLSFPARLPEYGRPKLDHLQNLGPPSLGKRVHLIPRDRSSVVRLITKLMVMLKSIANIVQPCLSADLTSELVSLLLCM